MCITWTRCKLWLWVGMPIMGLICFMWFNEEHRLQLARGTPHTECGRGCPTQRYPCSLAGLSFQAPTESQWHVGESDESAMQHPPHLLPCYCIFVRFPQPLIKGKRTASDVSFISPGSLEGLKMKGTYVTHVMTPPTPLCLHNCPPHILTKCTVSSCLQTQ